MTEGEILLVEDNEDDILLTQRAFKRNKIRNKLIIARDGQEAIDHLLVKTNHISEKPCPDLILLDIFLPS